MRWLVGLASWHQLLKDLALALLPGTQQAMRRLYATIHRKTAGQSMAKAMNTGARMVQVQRV